MQLVITIFDDKGNVVTCDVVEAQEATDAEIEDMVRMIESGTPAHLAGILAKQHQF